jgi:hypothetical protein
LRSHRPPELIAGVVYSPDVVRAKPGPARRWLIAELEALGVPATTTKIERLEPTGLVPRCPLAPRDDTDPSTLWPSGAVEHYAAAVPLIRQRHDCVDLAALTMLGWGYPVEKPTLERAYAKALFPPDGNEALADRITERYGNNPVPFLGYLVRHLRQHPGHTRETSDELAFEIVQSLADLLSGQVFSEDRIAALLTARFGPAYAGLAPELSGALAACFTRVATQFSALNLLNTVRKSSVEDLLTFQPAAAEQVDADLAVFGSSVDTCTKCAEGRAIWIALMIPLLIHAEQLDWDVVLVT